MPAFIQDHLQWWICGAITVLGIAVYGFTDLIRLSVGRIWAISSVCFSESVRRKIWLITPLAILGVIVVAQLQKPSDERDAIRETIKFCLFATGLLVTLTAIILACTNLPREIENRVIYTIVTKPTTRLEIVIGKILGFARVSALILIIMGLFTWSYLHLRALRFDRGISDRLNTAGEVDAVSRPTLEYYHTAGLLTARQMATTDDMQIYSRLPDPNSPKRYLAPLGEGDIIIPFEVTPADLIPPGLPAGQEAVPGIAGFLVGVKIGAEKNSSAPAPVAATPIPFAPTTKPSEIPAAINLQVLDSNLTSAFAMREINGGQPTLISDRSAQNATVVMIPPNAAEQIYKPGSDLHKPIRFYLQVWGATDGFDYFVEHDPASIIVPAAQGNSPRLIKPMPDPHHPGETAQATFRGREGTAGQQIRGAESGKAPVAIYRFSDATPTDDSGDVSFEFKSGIERSDEDADVNGTSTHMAVVAYDRQTKEESPPVTLALESNRLSYFKIPAQYLKGGDFDIRVQCKSTGHLLGLFPTSLAMVRGLQGFDFNLVKSLFIMWLMAILVITVAIFTSTFLSWPTAIVLTLVILLGRWGVEQLGDATQPGIGHMVAQDMGFTDPNKMKVVSSVTETLASGLNVLAKVLPDITQFAATEDIERGLVVPLSKMGAAIEVLLCYGLAILALAYVRLTFTEVAP